MNMLNKKKKKNKKPTITKKLPDGRELITLIGHRGQLGVSDLIGVQAVE